MGVSESPTAVVLEDLEDDGRRGLAVAVDDVIVPRPNVVFSVGVVFSVADVPPPNVVLGDGVDAALGERVVETLEDLEEGVVEDLEEVVFSKGESRSPSTAALSQREDSSTPAVLFEEPAERFFGLVGPPRVPGRTGEIF